ncbi:glycosyltransferase family 2 protein [Fertoebacter nigrum]|uniref:Glycosyltransferase family 2 protein n=1 Tax=Fertoeibacter niger TaxID=2656921 RepID=A0A8X8H2D9_9RHOB|nr:glycosyltransferase family 2 protein [Fertoeibacter niger]
MPDAAGAAPIVDAVVIGRNEGARLQACLASLKGQVRRIVYVDSGSKDGSQAMAARMGVQVVALDMTQPFTAARARNAGLTALEGAAPPDLVQMVDGDCEVVAGWLPAAVAFLQAHPRVTVVCGRRRERFPQASVYNRLCDREWNTPPGPATACGGDALMRFAPLMAVGGYREVLIAGEEPELCLRLIRAGGRVWRLEAEMTLHDAAMTRFGQWWRRTRRAGHAFAEGADLHGAGPERHWVRETWRALLWGAVLPLTALLLALVWHPLWLLLLLAWPLQVLRIARREGDWTVAAFLVLGKLAEAQGALGYAWGRLINRRTGLIEYK